MQASTINFYTNLAKGIARQFGPNCEAVVYDLQSGDPEHSIVFIENGHVTGRKVGDGPSQQVLEELRGDHTQLKDRFAYLTRVQDGRILKSSTIYIRDEEDAVVGIFSINCDITLILAVENAVKGFTCTETAARDPENKAKNVNALLEELIDQSLQLVGKPVALMTKEDRVKAIHFLDENGAFLITKSGDRVCKVFGISKYTLYSYIEEGKNS